MMPRLRNDARGPVQLRRTLPRDAGEVGALDEAAITEVAGESAPAVRNADELHDALLTLYVIPPVEAWAAWYGELDRSPLSGRVDRPPGLYRNRCVA